MGKHQRGYMSQSEFNFMKSDIAEARETINTHLPQLLKGSDLVYEFECGRNVYAPLEPVSNYREWDSVQNRPNVGLGIVIFRKEYIYRILRMQMYIKPDHLIYQYPRYHPATDLVEIYDDATDDEREKAIKTIKQHLVKTQTHFCSISLYGGKPTKYWAGSFKSIPESEMSLSARFTERKDGTKRLNRLTVAEGYIKSHGLFHSIAFGQDKLIPRLHDLLALGGTQSLEIK